MRHRAPWLGRPTYDPFPVNPYPTGRVSSGRRQGTVLDQSGWDILVRWDGAARAVWIDCERLASVPVEGIEPSRHEGTGT